jgi:ribonuclease HI
MRVAKTQFKKVVDNLAKVSTNEIIEPVEIDTEVDLTFENPGMLLSRVSQRAFTNIIRSLWVRPYRKSTFINFDHIRCAVDEMCGYTPSDPMIWKSIQSTTLQRRSREFYWKCTHNTFRAGDFWTHIEHLEIIGTCQVEWCTEVQL